MKQSVHCNRVAARIGRGGLSHDTTCVIQNSSISNRASRLFDDCLSNIRETVFRDSENPVILTIDRTVFAEANMFRYDQVPLHLKVSMNVDVDKIRKTIGDLSNPVTPEDTATSAEPEVYFYHSDHLGSASWITDGRGMPVQHLQYLPFGEPFVDQHPAGYRERYTFTGKEKDEETGYGYFGARYMDHELMTMWLSVDPMADKYPSISPYAYCAWNPIRLIDPDGREMNPVYNYKGILLGCTNEGFTGKIIIYDGENTSFEGMSSDDFVSANYSAEYYDMDNECRLDNVAKESMYRNILSNYDGTDINGYTFYQQDITFNFDKEKSGNYSVNPYLDHFLLNVSEKYLTYQDVIYDGQDAILFRGGHYDASVENIAASIIYHEWYGHYCNKWTEKGGTHYKCYEAVRDCPFFQKCTPEYRDDVLQQIINMK